MLSDYIVDYVEAQAKGDEKLSNKIAKELELLGMDRYTLKILANEFRKERGNGSLGR